jgi:hypothetical protein
LVFDRSIWVLLEAPKLAVAVGTPAVQLPAAPKLPDAGFASHAELCAHADGGEEEIAASSVRIAQHDR